MKRMLVVVGLMAIMLYATMVNAAVTGCINPYVYNDTGNATNVTAGNVCVNATDYDVNPTAAVNCGTWSACVLDACTAAEYYVGYTGDGTATCVMTDWVATGTNYWPADGEIIDATENVDTCSVATTGKSPSYDACLNDYTRQGPDGYCDGAGALDTDSATTYVVAGNVCYAGTDTNPNATVNCGTWSDCVAEATSADEYYVGYAAGGTGVCVATGWVAAGTTFNTNPGQTIWFTEQVDSCAVKGYAYTYDKGDMAPIVEDGLGTVGAVTVEWLDLIVLLIVLGFLIGIFMKMGGLFR